VVSCIEDSSGLAVAIGSQIVSVDLFANTTTRQKGWDWLLSGLLLDELTTGSGGRAPDVAEVRHLLREAQRAEWQTAEAVGEGREYRTEFAGKVGSALMLDGSMIHASVVSRPRAACPA